MDNIINNADKFLAKGELGVLLAILAIVFAVVIAPIVGVFVWAIRALINNLDMRLTETNQMLHELSNNFMQYLFTQSRGMPPTPPGTPPGATPSTS